jgi:rfaE bifunctional protein kinase chain/domain
VNPTHPQFFTTRYPVLRIAIVGDFCLDRYLEIDPAKSETSIETGLPVYNVMNVRGQPGASGTVLNNLEALGIGEIYAVGMAGQDGEGWELLQALRTKAGVRLDYFVQTAQRRTFTYTKPLLMRAGQPPEELSRLDIKNWTPTPPAVEEYLRRAVRVLADQVDAIILLEQVDVADTGVLTAGLLTEIGMVAKQHPRLLILADSRRGLGHFPAVTLKMNGAELARSLALDHTLSLNEVKESAAILANRRNQRVFVTLAAEGIVGAEPGGLVEHVPALPRRGEIDIVGAGDAVTANLTAALAAGAGLSEALKVANAAASIVIHQLGTTGTANVSQIEALLAAESQRRP